MVANEKLKGQHDLGSVDGVESVGSEVRLNISLMVLSSLIAI